MQPSQETVASFPQVAAKVWTTKQGDAQQQTRRLTSKLEELRTLKSQLLREKLKGEISKAEYQEENANLSIEIEMAEEQLQAVASSRASLESFVRFAELMLSDVATAGERATSEQRQRVQNLLFPEGICYSK